MKTLTQTIFVTVALTLLTACVVTARNVSDEEIQAADVELQVQKAQLEQSKAEFAAALAQAQIGQPAAPVLPTTPMPATPTQAIEASENNNIYTLTTMGFSYGLQSGSTGTILVIPSGQTKTEDLLTINEDMSVMSRIFEKNIEQTQLTTARGSIFVSRQTTLSTLLGGGRGEIQSIYLQDYGALFLMKVDFPLTPPPEMQDDEKETQKAEEGDPVWQEMRRQMYEPDKVDRRRRTDRPEEKYDPEKVENLKTTLIKALKHATNIRSLKPDESVVLTVTGIGGSTSAKIITTTRAGENQVLVQERDADGKTITRLIKGTGKELNDIGLSSPAILVIRAKKSDIDDFAKGDLDLDKFRERVQVLTCPLLSGAVGSIDSPSQNIGLY